MLGKGIRWDPHHHIFPIHRVHQLIPFKHYMPLVLNTSYNVKEGDPFPPTLLEPLTVLWSDPAIKAAYQRGKEAALFDR